MLMDKKNSIPRQVNMFHFFERDPFTQKQQFYLKAGVAINNIVPPTTIVTLYFVAGEDVIIGYNRYFGNSRFYFGGEVGFTTRGWSYGDVSIMDESGSIGDMIFRSGMLQHGFKFGPNIGFRHKIANNFYLDYHLGAYAAYYFAGGYYPDDLFGDEISYMNRSTTVHWDGGLSLGISLWYKRFCFDITYQNGFAPWEREFIREDNQSAEDFAIAKMNGTARSCYPSQIDYKHSIQFKLGIAF